MDERTYHRWANGYNTLACSDTKGPKWATVVGSKMRKNDDDKILTASIVGPSLSTHSKIPTLRSNDMNIMLTLSWTMFYWVPEGLWFDI